MVIVHPCGEQRWQGVEPPQQRIPKPAREAHFQGLFSVLSGHGGKIQRQLSGFEGSGDPQAPEASEPSGHPFGELDEAAFLLDETIGHPALEESKDAVHVLFDRLGKPSVGSEPAAVGPLEPPAELLGILLGKDLLQSLPQPNGSSQSGIGGAKGSAQTLLPVAFR